MTRVSPRSWLYVRTQAVWSLHSNMGKEFLAHEGASWRTRHFAVKAQGLREQIEIGQCKLKHVAGTERRADGLTKSLPRMFFEKFLVALGMRPSGQSLQSNSCTAA